MASTLPRKSAAVAWIPPEGSVNLGTGVPVVFDGNHDFSIGLWVQFDAAAPDVTLVTQENILLLKLQNGYLSAQFVGQITPVRSQEPLLPGQHYVVLTYAATGVRAGQMTLYVNGVLVGQAVISNIGAASTLPITVGGGEATLALWALNFYDIALAESAASYNWSPGAAADGLVASFCFCNVPANEPIADLPFTWAGGAEQRIRTSAMRFPGMGWVSPVPAAPVTASGAAYTIQAAVYLPYAAEQSGAIFGMGQVDLGSGVALRIGPGSGGGVLSVLHGTTSLVASGALDPEAWHNVAVTFDGTMLRLYADGDLVASVAAAPLAVAPATSVIAGAEPIADAPGVDMPFTGSIQTVDLWNIALTASQLEQYASALPFEEEGCIASFDLAEFSVDQVSQVSLISVNGPLPGTLYVPVPRGLSGESAGAASFAREKGRLLAGASALPPYRPTLPITERDIEKAIAGLKAILPAHTPQAVRQAAIAGQRAALEQAQAAVARGERLPGTFSYGYEGDHASIYFHDVDGDYEVLRFARDAVTPCGLWYISLGSTILFGILGILGVPLSSQKVSQAVSRYFTRYPRAAMAAATVLQEEISARSIVAFVRLLYQTGGFKSLITSLLKELSFWDFLFFSASLLVTFLELVVPNPSTAAWLAFMLTKITLFVAQLILVWNDQPPGCLSSGQVRIGTPLPIG
ncbi:LamG-like jellyroll fold domain-containing protein [Sphingomonas sp. KR3-1]|uniref:LamG-like jellyroll fold domain-containing protein n=1 Tax=Sphingomonas sp. KR3-1 TaxID=3156611 RepID=UPI0032B61B9E